MFHIKDVGIFTKMTEFQFFEDFYVKNMSIFVKYMYISTLQIGSVLN